jgi:hypothetical protein
MYKQEKRWKVMEIDGNAKERKEGIKRMIKKEETKIDSQ